MRRPPARPDVGKACDPHHARLRRKGAHMRAARTPTLTGTRSGGMSARLVMDRLERFTPCARRTSAVRNEWCAATITVARSSERAGARDRGATFGSGNRAFRTGIRYVPCFTTRQRPRLSVKQKRPRGDLARISRRAGCSRGAARERPRPPLRSFDVFLRPGARNVSGWPWW